MDRILTTSTSTLDLDIENSITIVSFRGKVKFDEYKEALMKAVDLVGEHRLENVMMNRLEIGELEPECRLWVKNEYLKVHIKPLIPNIHKVAVIESTSIVGAFYGKALYSALSLIYPNLTFKYYDTVQEGLNWFKEEKLAPNQLKPFQTDSAGNTSDEKNTVKSISGDNGTDRAPKPSKNAPQSIDPKSQSISTNQREKILDKFLKFFHRSK